VHRRDENCIHHLLRKLKEKFHFEDLVLEAAGKRLLKLTLEKQDGWIGFIWLPIV
jgi:hypothetical protein